MSEIATTSFSNKCEILADIWLNHREDPDLQDFIEDNDIGIPLGYILSEKLAEPVAESVKYIEQTFSLLLTKLELDDLGWNYFDEMRDESRWEAEDLEGN
jgi:hypothetical protein